MSDRRDLRPRNGRLRSASGLTLFALAFVVGYYAGGRLFLAPSRSREAGNELRPSETGPAGSLQPAVPTQQIGVPALGPGGNVRVGAAAPDFTLLDLQGQPHSLAGHAGRAVLINFWATWCPPCREEMPILERMYRRYRDQGFVVLGVNLTQLDNRGQVEPFRQELGLTFPILLDEQSQVSNGLYNVTGIPTSVFVGREGTIRSIYVGVIPAEHIESQIRGLLGVGRDE